MPAAATSLDGARLVGDHDVGRRAAGVRAVEGLGRGRLLGRVVAVVVAEPAGVVEAGDGDAVDGGLRVAAAAGLEQDDVAQPAHPLQQRPVRGAAGVVVAPDEEVGDAQARDAR